MSTTSTEQKKNPSHRPRFWTAEKVRPALIKARGVLSEAARILSKTYGKPCARETVWRLTELDPELKKLQVQTHEALLDLCESGVIRRAEAGDQKDQHFLLNTLGRSRGYCKTLNVQGAGKNGAIQIEPKFDFSGLSDEEIDQLETLARKARPQSQAA
jgi:hypothetical protein